MTDRTYNGVQLCCTEVHPTVNGWTNHATWLVNVWTDGDEEIPQICSAKHRGLNERVEALKYHVETYHLDMDLECEHLSGLGKDLLRSVLSDVDWYSIVRHYEDCATEDATEEDSDNDNSDD